MNLWLAAAAIIALVTTVVHAWLGGREIARPLLDAERLRNVPKYTMYYCWHLVTIILAGQALAFALAASGQGSRDLAVFATAGAGLFALWSLCMIGGLRLRLAHFPQWALFAPMAACGALGLWW
ncbi:MAG TPA: hypothetical protein VGO06_26995 [Bosea sp. (in: a-proteobacteria)]|jgi:hypothetical protein|uniref:hypothetical protein n=1 Tax=Bosea sp. (in: a-proteobacteria) TaxID=1871050 RepID=UPI002E0FDCC1|nr:hypothetical protein [Bosea sp. (in: a-proteobacteria)]